MCHNFRSLLDFKFHLIFVVLFLQLSCLDAWGGDVNEYRLIGGTNVIYGGYTGGRGVGIHEGYGTLGFSAFPEVNLASYRPFIDVRGHYIQNRQWAANAGIGMRWWNTCQSTVWGANCYYDYRSVKHGHFDQIGVGFEWLTNFIEFRLNAYIPWKTSVHAQKKVFDHCIGNYIAILKKETHASTGFDTELGCNIWERQGFSLYTGVGAYYFSNHTRKNRWGGRIHLLVSWLDRVTIEARINQGRYDNTAVQGVITLALPLEYLFKNNCNPSCCSCINALLTKPVQRNDMIVTNKQCCWKTNF
jgi:hypothetical protein